jgi:hypothetical protein
MAFVVFEPFLRGLVAADVKGPCFWRDSFKIPRFFIHQPPLTHCPFCTLYLIIDNKVKFFFNNSLPD